MQPDYLENDSEDEGIEDYKMGGYHAPHIGFINYILEKLWLKDMF